MTPRIVHRPYSVRVGFDAWEEHREKLILWSQHGDWCLVSREGPGKPEVVPRSVLDLSLPAPDHLLAIDHTL